MRDFARLDGWLLNDGRIIFTDLNPISGMEQNSFIFQQTSRVGFTHEDLLWNILINACKRENISIPQKTSYEETQKELIYVLFGGKTAERQVSLMSGTNVWLKLRKSNKFHAEPFLLDHNNFVWHLPYTYSLNHTVEEIFENCLTAEASIDRLEKYVQNVKKRLSFAPKNYNPRENLPYRLSFDAFLDMSKKENAFVFLALHGGEGENGTIQEKLEKQNLLYNGSKPKTSMLCMDKHLTGLAVSSMGDNHILTVPKKSVTLSSLFKIDDFEKYWQSLQLELSSSTFIIKPQRDGCSAGIVRLFSPSDLQKYLHFVKQNASFIPENSFLNQPLPIEMPIHTEEDYLIESFIETDYIRIQKNELIYKPKTGWIELTVGVLETDGEHYSLNPSITIAEGEVLSVEEKFQGGTGVNITPPLESIISKESRELIKSYIVKIATALNIQNYARLDIFFNVNSKILYLIEANTLPGLTPATVLYHQALAENPPISPKEFLEKLISNRKNSCKLIQ